MLFYSESVVINKLFTEMTLRNIRKDIGSLESGLDLAFNVWDVQIDITDDRYLLFTHNTAILRADRITGVLFPFIGRETSVAVERYREYNGMDLTLPALFNEIRGFLQLIDYSIIVADYTNHCLRKVLNRVDGRTEVYAGFCEDNRVRQTISWGTGLLSAIFDRPHNLVKHPTNEIIYLSDGPALGKIDMETKTINMLNFAVESTYVVFVFFAMDSLLVQRQTEASGMILDRVTCGVDNTATNCQTKTLAGAGPQSITENGVAFDSANVPWLSEMAMVSKSVGVAVSSGTAALFTFDFGQNTIKKAPLLADGIHRGKSIAATSDGTFFIGAEAMVFKITSPTTTTTTAVVPSTTTTTTAIPSTSTTTTAIPSTTTTTTAAHTTITTSIGQTTTSTKTTVPTTTRTTPTGNLNSTDSIHVDSKLFFQLYVYKLVSLSQQLL